MQKASETIRGYASLGPKDEGEMSDRKMLDPTPELPDDTPDQRC